MAGSDEASGRRMALPTAIAGLLGTLAGTVVGGLISLAAVKATIDAAEEASLRAYREEAYSAVAGDAIHFKLLIEEYLADDQEIDPAELTELHEFNRELARSLAVAFFIDSAAVHDTVVELEKAIADFANAAESRDKSDIDDLEAGVREAFEAFRHEAKEDLGSAG